MICPFATWLPISANTGGRISTVKGLVLHVQVGNGSLYGYFNNPSTQASAHFWVSKTGALEQYVDTDTVAWAQAAGNPNYLSVETEGFPTEPLTSDQILRVSSLLLWSSVQYKFPIVGPVAHGQQGFTPHCNPDGTPDPAWGNHSCPAPIRLGQMPAIVASLTPSPAPSIIKGTDGDTMTSLADGTFLHVWGPNSSGVPTHWWQYLPGKGTNPPNNWFVEALPS